MTCGFLIQMVFCQKKKTMWFVGVEVEQETSAPPPKKRSWIHPWSLSPAKEFLTVYRVILSFVFACQAGRERCIQPSSQAFSARSFLDSTMSCDVTERYSPRTRSLSLTSRWQSIKRERLGSRLRCIVICINSATTQMIDGTEKPMRSLQTRSAI